MRQAVDLRRPVDPSLGKQFVPQSPLRSVYGVALLLTGPDVDVIAGVLSMFSDITDLDIRMLNLYYSATTWEDQGHTLARINHIRPRTMRLYASASTIPLLYRTLQPALKIVDTLYLAGLELGDAEVYGRIIRDTSPQLNSLNIVFVSLFEYTSHRPGRAYTTIQRILSLLKSILHRPYTVELGRTKSCPLQDASLDHTLFA